MFMHRSCLLIHRHQAHTYIQHEPLSQESELQSPDMHLIDMLEIAYYNILFNALSQYFQGK